MGEDTLISLKNISTGEVAPRRTEVCWLRRSSRPCRLTRTLRTQEPHRTDIKPKPPARTTRSRAALEASLFPLKTGSGSESLREDSLLLPAETIGVVACCRAMDDVTCVTDDIVCLPEDDVTFRDDVTRVIAAVAASGKENLISSSKRVCGDARGMRTRARTRRRVLKTLRRPDDSRSGVSGAESTHLQQIGGFVASTRLPALQADCSPQHTDMPTTFQVSCPRPRCRGFISERHVSQGVRWHERARLAVPSAYICSWLRSPGLAGLFCPLCDACGAVQVGGRWVPLASLLRADPAPPDGWRPVRSAGERAALYLLSQHVYGGWERSVRRGEHRWQPVPPGDAALLLWSGAQAVGFASLKLRGQLLDGGPEYFVMDVLDMVYVRRGWRRQGHAGQLLLRLLSERPGRRLGVTRPVPAMWRLLCALLSAHPAVRPYLFLVQWAGSEGFRVNVWQALRSHVAEHRREDGYLDSAAAVSRMLAGDWPDVQS